MRKLRIALIICMVTFSLNALSQVGQKPSIGDFGISSNEREKTEKQKFDDNLRENIKNNGIPSIIGDPQEQKELLRIFNQMMKDDAPPTPATPPSSKTEKERRPSFAASKFDD